MCIFFVWSLAGTLYIFIYVSLKLFLITFILLAILQGECYSDFKTREKKKKKTERMLIQRVLTIYYMKTKDISQNNLKTAVRISWTFWHIPLLHISQTPPWNSGGLGITCNHVEKEKLRPRKGDGCTFSRLSVFEDGTSIEMHISRLLGDLFFHTNKGLDCLCLGGYK